MQILTVIDMTKNGKYYVVAEVNRCVVMLKKFGDSVRALEKVFPAMLVHTD